MGGRRWSRIVRQPFEERSAVPALCHEAESVTSIRSAFLASWRSGTTTYVRYTGTPSAADAEPRRRVKGTTDGAIKLIRMTCVPYFYLRVKVQERYSVMWCCFRDAPRRCYSWLNGHFELLTLLCTVVLQPRPSSSNWEPMERRKNYSKLQ